MTGPGRLGPAVAGAAPWMVSLALHGAVLGGVLWADQAATVAPAIGVEVVVIAAPALTPPSSAAQPAPDRTPPSAPSSTGTARAPARPPPRAAAPVAAIEETDRSALADPPPRPDRIAPPAGTEAPGVRQQPVSPPVMRAPRSRPVREAMRGGRPSNPPPVSRGPPRPRTRPVATRPAAPDKPTSVTVPDTGGKAPVARAPVTAIPATVPAAGAQTAALAPETPPRLGAAEGNAAPRYPFVARENGWQGRVVLRVAVDAGGRARDITVTTSSGHGVLDRAARAAVGDWRFRPATRLGRPVAGVVDVPISFRLRD